MTEDLAKELFFAALELAPEDRSTFLAGHCGADHALRSRVEVLLRAHESALDFMESPTELLIDAVHAERREETEMKPGARLGRYELVERIGRGGFGSVWRAHQTEPVRRDVAVKVLHPGMDTEQIVARFAAERQTLARMDHPGIAKVLDAGQAANGRPFFVMELVSGQSITEYCMKAVLGVRARLELFLKVCRALQHAHHKGIVHRDLKPSNVLVAERPDGALPVIIDFGIAKLIHGDGSGTHTHAGPAVTEGGRLLGTPDYMSPEQASGGVDVDSRTDVHALGVLLFELLTGRRPFAGPPGQPDSASSLLRRVCEDEPPRPSRILADYAPAGWPVREREVRADLDWIVLRAMEKDRRRRYPTPSALAEDVERHLADEPVLAGPPGTGYRLSKFIRRNRLFVTAMAAVVLALLLGAGAAVYGLAEARAAERIARRDKEAARSEARRATLALDVLDDLLAGVDGAEVRGAADPAEALCEALERDLAGRVTAEPTVEARLRVTLGRAWRNMGFPDRARPHLERALVLERGQIPHGPGLPRALLEQARLAYDGAALELARRSIEEALVCYQAAIPQDPLHIADALDALATVLARSEQRGQAMVHAQAALQLRAGVDGAVAAVAMSLAQIAHLQAETGDTREAEDTLRKAMALLVEHKGEQHRDTLTVLHNLGMVLQQRGELDQASEVLGRALVQRRQALGPNHPAVASAEVNFAWLLSQTGRHEEALALLRDALVTFRERLGEQHMQVTETINRMGAVLWRHGQWVAAESQLREALHRYQTLPGHLAEGHVGCMSNLANLLWTSKRGQEAEALQLAAVELARKVLPAQHPTLSSVLTNLAAMREQAGAHEEAGTLLKEALSGAELGGRSGEATMQRQRLEQLRKHQDDSRKGR